LLWLTVLEVSVHDWLVLLVGFMVRQQVMVGAWSGAKLFILWPGNKEKMKGPGSHNALWGYDPNDLNTFHSVPPLKDSNTSQLY
jgi:hypothetical protein